MHTASQQHRFNPPADGYWDVMDVPAKVRASVGHNRGISSDGSPGFFRDDLDSDYINRIITGTTHSQYRGRDEWTNSGFTRTSMYKDSDGDHMPDWFENQHVHLNPNDSSDMNKKHVDWNFGEYQVKNNAGYTNLEICAEFYAGGFETMIDGTNDLKIVNL